jgi:transaldolase
VSKRMLNESSFARGSHVSPLLRMTENTPTRLWSDSATPWELETAIGWGAVGATCNPVLALAALRSDLPRWHLRIREYAAECPTASESQIGWAMVEELSIGLAGLLADVFVEHAGRDGRISIQTDPRYYCDTDALVAQAVQFDALAPNVIVKIPATEAGIRAMEEATYRGVSINATVSFTVAQTLAVAEAIERGLIRRENEGLDVSRMGPVCTIMLGRLDDWLKAVTVRDRITVDPGILEWAGVAVFKHAYRIYCERGFRTRLLSAAFRNHMHWSELIGGDVVISPPFEWQVRLNSSGIEPLPRINEPVADAVLSSLYENIPEFRRSYDSDGMSIGEFQDFGATRATLRQFLVACADLESLVRDVLLPDPTK